MESLRTQGLLPASRSGLALPTHPSFVTVPRVVPREVAAVTDVGEMVGGVEPRSALLSAAATTGGSGEAATTGVEAGSSGASEVGSGGLLVAPSVLFGGHRLCSGRLLLHITHPNSCGTRF